MYSCCGGENKEETSILMSVYCSDVVAKMQLNYGGVSFTKKIRPQRMEIYNVVKMLLCMRDVPS